MQLLQSKNVANIFRRTLNLIDYHMVDHAERVAYIALKIMQLEGTYSERQILENCLMCSWHDIGAYKTEEIDSLTNPKSLISFEISNSKNHAIYSYLFIKKFSSLSHLSDALLHHHTPYIELMDSECKNKELASLIYLCDRVDLLVHSQQILLDKNLLSDFRNQIFSSKYIDILIEAEKRYDIRENLMENTYLSELMDVFENAKFTTYELDSFLQTLIYSIDFRSEVTVMHTITTVSMAVEIAKLMNLSVDEIRKIYYGALLHDIGKISTPTMVLEKKGKLSEYEFKIMKEHVSVSEYILQDYIDEEIKNIAVRHHEKLDGSGYPHGLREKDLSLSEKIVCVADILSALVGKRSYKDSFDEENIKNILINLSKENKICGKVVEAVLENYLDLINNAVESCRNSLDKYRSLHEEYKQISEKMTLGRVTV